MAAYHVFIIRVVSPSVGEQEVHGWGRIMTNMGKVAGELSAESEETLLRVLRSQTEVLVLRGSGHPHLFTPLEFLQEQAVQALAAGWGRKHRAAIEEFAERTESELLEAIARSCLQRMPNSRKPRRMTSRRITR